MPGWCVKVAVGVWKMSEGVFTSSGTLPSILNSGRAPPFFEHTYLGHLLFKFDDIWSLCRVRAIYDTQESSGPYIGIKCIFLYPLL